MISTSDLQEMTATYVMQGDFKSKELETYHLILAPSFACNIGCTHCYLPDHAADILPEKRVRALVDEWADIVLRERGPMGGIFHLKGGEPLILPYLNSVIDEVARQRTLQFMMTTNGTRCGKETFERLVDLNEALDGNVTIIVSLDGSTEKMNAILRRPGNYPKTIRFIEQLSEAGINFYLNCVAHKHNLDDLPNYLTFARRLGASQVNFLSFVPKGYGAEIANLRPNPLEVFRRIQSVWDEGDDHVRNMLAGSLSDIVQQERCGKCTAAECVGGYRGLFYIIPNGDTYSCPNLNFPELKVGNIIESACAELVERVQPRVYNRIRTATDDTQDRYLCKGERFLPLSANYLETEFAPLQRELGLNSNGNGMAVCFSRNW